MMPVYILHVSMMHAHGILIIVSMMHVSVMYVFVMHVSVVHVSVMHVSVIRMYDACTDDPGP